MTTLIALAFLAQRAEIVRFDVGEVERVARVFRPSKRSSQTPVVFVFHGHGGTVRSAARKFRIHELWPEAAVVYAQGLTGVVGITDPDGERTGWQKRPDTYGDRDLLFVDAMLSWAKEEFGAEPSRTFATGHSNGSQFTWLLQHERSDRFAGFAGACAPAANSLLGGPMKATFVIAGSKDQLVPIAIMDRFARLMAIKHRGGAVVERDDGIVVHPGTSAPLWVWTYVGSHRPPRDLGERLVEFFQSVVGGQGRGSVRDG